MAELIVHNAHVITQDVHQPYAEAFAVTEGKVIAVGPGKLDDNGKPMEIGLRVNDVVYYGKYSGTEVEIDGTKYVILRESDVLGVLE